jgi:hypothetical protein
MNLPPKMKQISRKRKKALLWSRALKTTINHWISRSTRERCSPSPLSSLRTMRTWIPCRRHWRSREREHRTEISTNRHLVQSN